MHYECSGQARPKKRTFTSLILFTFDFVLFVGVQESWVIFSSSTIRKASLSIIKLFHNSTTQPSLTLYSPSNSQPPVNFKNSLLSKAIHNHFIPCLILDIWQQFCISVFLHDLQEMLWYYEMNRYELDRRPIRLSPRYGLSTPYRLTNRETFLLFKYCCRTPSK